MLRLRLLSERPVYQFPGFCIRGVGIREAMPRCFIDRPQGTGDALFMLFHERVWIGPPGGQQHSHPAGTIVFWKTGVGHFYGNTSERWSHSWIHCEGKVIMTALRKAGIRLGVPFPLRSIARIEGYLYDLHEELTVYTHPDATILRNTMINLLREAARSGRGLGPRPIPEALVKVRHTIDNHYDQPLSLQDLAALAHLSVSHFCTEFRRHFGVPPNTYLLQRRMHTAAALLRGTSLRIGQIGKSVGYEDPHHFSKFFKTHFGIAPSRVRGTSLPDQGPSGALPRPEEY